MDKGPINVAASVNARLLNLSRETGRPFQSLLTRYALERLLYRLSLSEHRDHFVLKGAMLMTNWFSIPFRSTEDIDLLSFGSSDEAEIVKVFHAICRINANDGVFFDAEALSFQPMREALLYGGARLKTFARIGAANIRIVIDIGIGDAIEPGLSELEMKVLLDQPAPKLRAYRMETVIAEKLQTMIVFGTANSRMKDYYDIWMLYKNNPFIGDDLPRAISSTFKRRNTQLPVSLPDGLTDRFADPNKNRQWLAFLESIDEPLIPLKEIVRDLASFLMPVIKQAKSL